jgi:hypothetical protein
MLPLRVIPKEGDSLLLHSPEDFERAFRVRYLPHVHCVNAQTQTTLEKCHRKALDKGWITPRQKWLGQHYAKAMRGELPTSLTIIWLSTKIGYGVFTDNPLPAGSFIGEYTGLLHKRRLWRRWDNLYCFDYTVGERKSTSLVIDCEEAGNHTRFLNHSARPNLELVSVYDQATIRVILYAKTAIQAGTQLCYDYGQSYWENRRPPSEL